MIRGTPGATVDYHVTPKAAQELRFVHASLRLMALLAQPTTPRPEDLTLSRAQLSACFKSLGESVRTALEGMTPIHSSPSRDDRPGSDSAAK